MELRAETSVFDDKLLKEDINNAQETADNAQVIAGTTAQYFWFLEEIGSVPAGVGTGAHITNKTKEEFLNNPVNGGGNLLARSNGIAIRDGLTELAIFSADQLRIGKANAQRAVVNSSSLELYNAQNNRYFMVSANGMTYGTHTVADTTYADGKANAAQSAAEATASADATAKANAAQANAEKVAKDYLYIDGNGALNIASANPSTATRKVNISANGIKIQNDANNYALVESSGMDIYQGGNSVASFGATARIGKTESANTGNIYIDNTSVNVRKGSTVLSTFTDSGAELGKNSNTAIINMCNNAFKINGQYEQFISANDTFAVNIKNNASTIFRKVEIGAGEESCITFFEQPSDSTRSPITNIYAGSGLLGRSVAISLAPDPYLEDSPEIILNSEQCIELHTPRVQLTQSIYSTSGSLYYAYSAPKTGSQTYNAVWTKETSGNDYYRLGRPSSSSRRYKEDIKPVENDELDPHRLYDIPVMQFKYKEGYFPQEDEYENNRTDVVGFIAEDVLEHYPRAAIIIDEEVDNWNERYIIPPMLKLIQEQNDRITELERRLL